jgi:hypothetical protein
MESVTRLLQGGGTLFERELLEAGIAEEVPIETSQRMAVALGLAHGSLPPPPMAGSTFTTTAAGGGGAAGAGAGASTGTGALLAKVAAGAVVVGGLLIGGVQLWPEAPSDSTAPFESPATAPFESPATAPEERSLNERDSAKPEGPAEPGKDDSPSVEPPKVEERAAKPVGKTQRARLPDNGLGGSGDVAAEVRLLDRVRSSIARGERGEARRDLQRYDARFPSGALRKEANLLRKAASESPTSGSSGVGE